MPIGCVGPGLDMNFTRKLRWAPPHAELRHLAALSIPSAAWTTIVFDDIDLHGNAAITFDGVHVGAFPGWWTLNFNLAWTSNGSGLRAIRLLLNGTDPLAEHNEEASANTLIMDMQCSTDHFISGATDYVTAQAYQDHGGGALSAYTLTLAAGWDTPLFTATYLGGPPP